ncbi:MAG: YaiI/YqxD family protein [Halanaerobiales bacterium]
MRVLIDGDACPVIDITEDIAEQKGVEVIIFTDITHQISSDNQVVVLDKANQSVDMALFNQCQKGDIVVTQDYGLASLVLSKGARALNQYGLIYTEKNIDRLLMQRHLHAKMRRAGVRHSNPGKRTKEDDSKYRAALLTIIE